MIEPHPLFASFQPLVQTIKTYGECHGTSYDDRDGGELLGVININVRPGLLEPRQDQTVETIIQDYFNKQFECTPIKCHDCPNLLPGTQSFAVINSPSYISFAIERYFKLFFICMINQLYFGAFLLL